MKELEDFNWFPAIFRNFQTSFIGFVVVRFGFYKPFVQYLQGLGLAKKTVTDLCSGSGEPAISIFHQSNCFSSLLLTDKYPTVLPFTHPSVSYSSVSTDALQPVFGQAGYYTLYNAFHHFTDAEKLQLVRNIQSQGAEAFVVEVLEPTAACLLKVCFMTTIGCLLLTPFIRPLSFGRLFFTYILPINLFTITLDGIISVFKSRSLKQYQLLFANENQSVKTLRLKNGLSSLIVIHIQPTL